MRERSQSTHKNTFPSMKRPCFSIILAFLVALGESMNMDVSDGEESCVIIDAKKGDTINGNYELLTPGSPKDLMVVVTDKEDLLYKKKELVEHYFRLKALRDGEHSMCFLNNNKVAEEKWQNEYPKGQDAPSALEVLQEKKTGGGKDGDEVTDKGYTPMMDVQSGWYDDLESWYAVNSGFKTIGFGLRLGEETDSDVAEVDGPPGKDKDKANFLAKEADALLQVLNSFNDHESNMRGRENIHRASLGQTSSRLMWYTFIEGAVLLAVSWTQLSYIRRFFETKRIL